MARNPVSVFKRPTSKKNQVKYYIKVRAKCAASIALRDLPSQLHSYLRTFSDFRQRLPGSYCPELDHAEPEYTSKVSYQASC